MLRDNLYNAIGMNNNNNQYISDAVASNRDGSMLERLEDLAVVTSRQATKALTTTANGNTTIFNYTGTIRILAITGIVNTIMEAKTQNTKLAVLSDALTAVDICANVDLTAAAVGTLLTITGTAANAMVASANGALAPGQVSPVVATCTTAGIIRQVAGAANTGAITWNILWEPVSPGATLVAA
jgi:hypothetical protein